MLIALAVVVICGLPLLMEVKAGMLPAVAPSKKIIEIKNLAEVKPS
jgi:hypothetical protein